MTTSPTVPNGSPTPTERVPLRIRLSQGDPSGPLDGAWWPQSRDLQTEAADLVDAFPEPVGRVERMLFSRPDWDVLPGTPSMHRIHARRGVIDVGSFPSDDTHVMVVTLWSGQRLRLLVVPSDTSPGVARRAMEQAANGANTQTPRALLGLPGRDQSEIGDHAWNGELGFPSPRRPGDGTAAAGGLGDEVRMRFVVRKDLAPEPAWWLLDHPDHVIAWAGRTFATLAHAEQAAHEFRIGAEVPDYRVQARPGGRWWWTAWRTERDRVAVSADWFGSEAEARAAALRVQGAAGAAVGP